MGLVRLRLNTRRSELFPGGTVGGALDRINVSLRLASGSDPINVSQASYTISSPSGNTTVISGNDATDPVSHFRIQGMDSEDGSVLKDQEDLLISQIDLDAASNIEPLEESESVKLIIQAPAGGQIHVELKTPRNIEDGDRYIL